MRERIARRQCLDLAWLISKSGAVLVGKYSFGHTSLFLCSQQELTFESLVGMKSTTRTAHMQHAVSRDCDFQKSKRKILSELRLYTIHYISDRNLSVLKQKIALERAQEPNIVLFKFQQSSGQNTFPAMYLKHGAAAYLQDSMFLHSRLICFRRPSFRHRIPCLGAVGFRHGNRH